MFEKAQVFAGKVVVITGGSRGIGFAAVKEFLKAGAKVCFLSHYEETGKAALAKLAEINPDYPVIWRCIDLCSEEQAKALFDEVEALWGRVDVLINNAGTQNDNDIDINLKALIHITEKYGIQDNIRSVLNIGSASAHTGAEFPEYCASKGGVLAYTKNVALRIAKYGATCNSLDPGGVLTPLNECVMNDPVLWEQIMAETPLKRWATAEEIAEWAYFLTVTNTFCTGQSIVVDGGEAINYHFVWKEQA